MADAVLITEWWKQQGVGGNVVDMDLAEAQSQLGKLDEAIATGAVKDDQYTRAYHASLSERAGQAPARAGGLGAAEATIVATPQAEAVRAKREREVELGKSSRSTDFSVAPETTQQFNSILAEARGSQGKKKSLLGSFNV